MDQYTTYTKCYDETCDAQTLRINIIVSRRYFVSSSYTFEMKHICIFIDRIFNERVALVDVILRIFNEVSEHFLWTKHVTHNLLFQAEGFYMY